MATQTLNFIKNHSFTVGFTSLTFSCFAFYFYKSRINKQKLLKQLRMQQQKQTQKEQIKYKQQQQAIYEQLLKFKNIRKRLLQQSNKFKVQYIDQKCAQILTQQTILNLLSVCTELVDPDQLNKIYQKSRKARRSIFNKILLNAIIRSNTRRDSLESVQSNFQNQIKMANISSSKILSYPEILSFSQIYYRFICTFEQEFKYLIEKTQKDFVAFLDIRFQIITQSINYHISKQDNENFKNHIQQWTSALRQSLKQIIHNLRPYLYKYNQSLSPDVIKQVLLYENQFMEQKRDKILQMIHKLGITNQEEMQCLPTLLSCLLQDAVWSKFNIQQQQVTLDSIHLSKNKDLQLQVQRFQQLSQKLIQQMFHQVNKQDILQVSDYF